MPDVRFHAVVSGQVQGVCFRAWTQDKAESLGLTGWVQNLHDGDVEVLIEGEETAARDFVSALHDGPPQAQVRAVKVEQQVYRNEFSDFSIRRR